MFQALLSAHHQELATVLLITTLVIKTSNTQQTKNKMANVVINNIVASS